MPLHFASKAAYLRWQAYRHIHHIASTDRGKIYIRGKVHKVIHSKKK